MNLITINPLLEKTLTNLISNKKITNKKIYLNKNTNPQYYINNDNNLGVIYIIKGKVSFSNLEGSTIVTSNKVLHYQIDSKTSITPIEDSIIYMITINQKLVNHIKNSRETIIQMYNLLNKKDDYTFKHGQRVAYYASIISSFNNEKISYNLLIASIFHDIGKVSVPIDILNKTSKLTPDEYLIMQKHPYESYKLLKASFNEQAAIIAYHHHETLDGKGYPLSLKAESLSTDDRILAVADIFDALTTTRCYSKAMSFTEAFEIMKTKNKKQLDQNLVTILENILTNDNYINIK